MPLVRIEKGESAGQTYLVEHASVIGRDPKVDIPIIDEKASRQHARLLREGGRYVLEDLGSKNGTLLNGKRVDGKEPIDPGDHIRIGLTWIHFGVEEVRGKLEGILKDYKIEDSIQHGSLGELYLATQLSLDRQVALKILPPNLVKANPTMKELFLQSLVGMASLNHENVTTLLDFGMDESTLYFTTEHVDGVALSDYVVPDEPLDTETALLIGLSAAQALAHAHERKVTHGSISPTNIHIGARRIVLTNFGISRIFSDGTRAVTAAESLLSDADYLAPEQVEETNEVDERTDIYALGIVLYRMLCGRVPFREATLYDTINRRLGAPPRPVDQVNPAIPPQVGAIVKRCLEKNPAARYQRASDLAEDLSKVHAHIKVLALQGHGHRLLFGFKNEFFYLLDWAPFRWVFFPLWALVALVLLRIYVFET